MEVKGFDNCEKTQKMAEKGATLLLIHHNKYEFDGVDKETNISAFNRFDELDEALKYVNSLKKTVRGKLWRMYTMIDYLHGKKFEDYVVKEV